MTVHLLDAHHGCHRRPARLRLRRALSALLGGFARWLDAGSFLPPAPYVPARPVLSAPASRMPGRLESGTAAGEAPGPAEPGAVPPHPVYGPLADTPPEGITVALAPGVTVVVGRHAASLPRLTAPGSLPRVATSDAPPWEIDTTSLPAVRETVYGQAPVAEVLESERLAGAMTP